MGKAVYIWQPASDCPEELIVTHDKSTVDGTSLRKAAHSPVSESALFFHDGPKSDLDSETYIPNTAMLPLVSQTAAREIAQLPGVQVQAIPARVRCSDDDIPCILLNPLRTVVAVDWASSQAVFISGTKQAMKFNRLQLIPEALGNIPIARLDEYRSFILVSEDVKRIFASSALCEFDLPSRIKP